MFQKNNYPVCYKLIKTESLQLNFSRLLMELNSYAISICRFRSIKHTDDSIHEIRKTMKRVRALLKLFRTAIGEETYQYENFLFRDISRSISDLRINSVNIKTLNTIIKSNKLKENERHFRDLVHELQIKHQELIKEMVFKQKVQRSISILLKSNKQKINKIPEFACEFEMLASGLRRMHKRCLVNLHRAMSQPSAENVHNFRKPVKYLWNQMILLRPVWSSTIGQSIRHLDTLGERLGNEHDLAELERLIFTNYYDDYGAEPIVHYIRKERNHIRKIVWPLAMKVFAEKPGAFANRITAYWNASCFSAGD